MDGIEKLWNDLEALDAASVAKRTGVRILDKVYLVGFLNHEIRVDPASRSIDAGSNHLKLAVLSFLVSGEIRPPEGVWVTEKELPGGSIFFQGPHKMPVDPITDLFGKNAAVFVDRGTTLGGVRSEFGDGSIEFNVLPGVRMCLVLWEEDEEFPPECTVMFDRSFKRMLALDVVLGLTFAVVEALVDKELDRPVIL